MDAENASMNRIIGLCVSNSLSSIKDVEVGPLPRMLIYPVCFDSQFTVETTMREGLSASLVLRDLRGCEMARKNMDLPSGKSKMQFQCPANLAPQMYFVELVDRQTGYKHAIQRVMKN